MAGPDINRRILILRHAKSDWAAGFRSDFERPLNGRGRRAAALMGAWLADEAPTPSLVLCSAARRAAETWAIVARQWPDAPDPVLDETLYLAETADLLERLRSLDDGVETVCLVGHHPGFDGLAIQLAEDLAAPGVAAMQAKFPTAALADLAFEGPWSALAPGKAALLRFVRPKDLV